MRSKLAILALLAGLYGIQASAETTQVKQINGREFRGTSAGAHVFSPSGVLQLFCFPDSNNSTAAAQLRLPSGASLQSMRLYAVDSGSQDLQVSLSKGCQPSFAGGPITSTSLLTLSTSGTPGNTTVTGAIPLQPVVDNEQCVYTIIARFGDTTTACDPNLQLQRVRLQWAK
ncbi:MAG: hypothetical protein ABI411_09920 [Tahibacter sp.]